MKDLNSLWIRPWLSRAISRVESYLITSPSLRISVRSIFTTALNGALGTGVKKRPCAQARQRAGADSQHTNKHKRNKGMAPTCASDDLRMADQRQNTPGPSAGQGLKDFPQAFTPTENCRGLRDCWRNGDFSPTTLLLRELQTVDYRREWFPPRCQCPIQSMESIPIGNNAVKVRVTTNVIFLCAAGSIAWLYISIVPGDRPTPSAAIASALAFVVASEGVFLRPRFSYWLGLVSGIVALPFPGFLRIEFRVLPNIELLDCI